MSEKAKIRILIFPKKIGPLRRLFHILFSPIKMKKIKVLVHLDAKVTEHSISEKEVCFEVEPGEHTVCCQIGKTKTDVVVLQARAGDEYTLNYKKTLPEYVLKDFVWASVLSLLIWLVFGQFFGHLILTWVGLSVMYLCIFIQFGSLLYSFWRHDIDWGQQYLRLEVVSAPEGTYSFQRHPDRDKRMPGVLYIAAAVILPALAVLYIMSLPEIFRRLHLLP